MKTAKIYTYTNDIGIKKILWIDPEKTNESGALFNLILEAETKEYCCSGYNTEKELAVLLAHYGVEYEYEEG